jgi:hypothetical protein
MAEEGPLLHDSQMGGRRKKSAVDTAILLTNYIERNKAKGRRSSVVFLDIKGAFDHVAKKDATTRYKAKTKAVLRPIEKRSNQTTKRRS